MIGEGKEKLWLGARGKGRRAGFFYSRKARAVDRDVCQ